MPQSSLCRAWRLPGMTMKENRFRRRFRRFRGRGRTRFRNRHPASGFGPPFGGFGTDNPPCPPARFARALAGSSSSPAYPFYFAGGAAAAAALEYFATMRLTRGMAASVCFLAMGRSFS